MTLFVMVWAAKLEVDRSGNGVKGEKIKVDKNFPWGMYPLWRFHKFKGIALRPVPIPGPPAEIPLPPPPPPSAQLLPPPPLPSSSYYAPTAPYLQSGPPPSAYSNYGAAPYSPAYGPVSPPSYGQQFPSQSYDPSFGASYGQQQIAPPSASLPVQQAFYSPFGAPQQGPFNQMGSFNPTASTGDQLYSSQAASMTPISDGSSYSSMMGPAGLVVTQSASFQDQGFNNNGGYYSPGIPDQFNNGAVQPTVMNVNGGGPIGGPFDLQQKQPAVSYV